MTSLEEIVKTLQDLKDYRDSHKAEFFEPYDKQKIFFGLGAACRERLLSAGNQLGKSEAGAFETACHLTGIYPDWWKGRRWT